MCRGPACFYVCMHVSSVLTLPWPLPVFLSSPLLSAGWAEADGSAGTSIFYGGLAQFMAGIWCFRRNDTLGAFAFCTYGAWWIGLVTFGLLFASSQSSQVRSQAGHGIADSDRAHGPPNYSTKTVVVFFGVPRRQ